MFSVRRENTLPYEFAWCVLVRWMRPIFKGVLLRETCCKPEPRKSLNMLTCRMLSFAQHTLLPQNRKSLRSFSVATVRSCDCSVDFGDKLCCLSPGSPSACSSASLRFLSRANLRDTIGFPSLNMFSRGDRAIFLRGAISLDTLHCFRPGSPSSYPHVACFVLRCLAKKKRSCEITQ